MKIATYNINGINGRIENLLRWLSEAQPDVVCLQELKAPNDKFPERALLDAGYHAIWQGQQSWNGVAILSRYGEIQETRRGLPGEDDDLHSRYIEAFINGVVIGCLYLPNGNPYPGLKFDYKLRWMERLKMHADKLLSFDLPVALIGDFNVMPTELDTYKPEKYVDNALFRVESRAAFKEFVESGWTDAIREIYPTERIYTFWDYLRNAYGRDAGLRLDHFLLNKKLTGHLMKAGVDKHVRGWVKSSDHAPVWIEIKTKLIKGYMENFTMLQFFELYYPADGSLWNHFKEDAERLKKIGIDTVWLPPAHKGMAGDKSSGYDSYDLYDLGEFDQKGSVRTKYGTKEELIAAVSAAQAAGLKVYADVVLDHMGGADEKEMVTVRKVNPDNRNEFISDPYEIESFTKFTFPGRKGKYSQFIWDFHCFAGIDYDARADESAIFSIQNEYGEGWQEVASKENGNYDFLMLDDIDLRNPQVREELKRWGKWFFETVGINGFRLDAIKHMDPNFFNEWLDYLRSEFGHEFFTVGEFWAPGDLPSMLKYIEYTGGRMSLFDAPLHGNLHKASNEGNAYNLCTIFDNSLVQANPALAVTLVENHDTQPLQSLEQPVQAWFRPIAYSLILLREAGYPCVFYTDLYGSKYQDKGADGQEHEVILKKVNELETLLWARKTLAFGQQRDYFDHPNCIGWTRAGDDEHAGSGCAVIISNGDAGNKVMEVGSKFAGQVFSDKLNKVTEEITIDDHGWAEFKVLAGSVSVWGVKN